MGNLLPKGASQHDGVFLDGVSPSMRTVQAVIRELAQSDVPVLLLAERGVGKHATAQRIHAMSGRGRGFFRSLACSLLKPEDLDAAVMNGAASADGGTIYLDEMAELNASCQARLRDALANVAKIDRGKPAVRFICGSEQDLEAGVKAGRLREDLYYRMSGVCLRLPPLRQRKEDIPLLTSHFLSKYAEEYRHAIPQLSAETQKLFQSYSWPGNLRELEDAARVLVAVGDERIAMEGLRARLHRPNGNGNGNGRGVSLKAASRAASHQAEKELILNALTQTRWNRRRAAEQLQISYKALLYKLKQIGCERHGTP